MAAAGEEEPGIRAELEGPGLQMVERFVHWGLERHQQGRDAGVFPVLRAPLRGILVLQSVGQRPGHARLELPGDARLDVDEVVDLTAIEELAASVASLEVPGVPPRQP